MRGGHYLRLASLLCSFLLITDLANAQWTNGQGAFRVFGQPDFVSNTANNGGISASTLSCNKGITIDFVNNKIYVADRQNHRVLRYAYPPTTDQPVAEAVFGQPDFISSTNNNGGIADKTLNIPVGLAIDANGNLWVTDAGNQRILRFDNAATLGNFANASVVVGQPNFVSSTANNGGIADNRLSGPNDVHIDANGNLWVADRGNSRVLRYANATGLMTNASASIVLGQPNFTSNTANNGGIAANRMNEPPGVFVDTNDNLWVADRLNHRVLRFANANTLSTNAAASQVLGQPDFVSNTPNNGGIGANTLIRPNRAIVDDNGNLYIQDGNNNRVLIFLSAAAKGDFANADFVLGQVDFISNGNGIGPSVVDTDGELGPTFAFDPTRGILWLSDVDNNRVLGFQGVFPNAKTPLIPTLSQWGLIVLALMLVIFGVVGIREWRKVSST